MVHVRVDERRGEPARPQLRLQRADPLLQLARGNLRRVEHHKATLHRAPPSVWYRAVWYRAVWFRALAGAVNRIRSVVSSGS